MDYLVENSKVAPCAGHIKYPNLRSWPIRRFSHHLLYHVDEDDTLTIIRIMRGAQDVPRAIEDDHSVPDNDDRKGE